MVSVNKNKFLLETIYVCWAVYADQSVNNQFLRPVF